MGFSWRFALYSVGILLQWTVSVDANVIGFYEYSNELIQRRVN